MRTSLPVKSYKTSANSPAGSSFLRGGGGGGGAEIEVVEVGEESEMTRLTGGGANCFLWEPVPEDEGGRKDDGLVRGCFEFLGGFLTDVKKPLAEDRSTSLPNV